MASLAELCPHLAPSGLTHLQRLVRSWGMLADISFADLLLFVPVADGGYVIGGQMRPTTSRSIHRTDLIGRHVARGDRPLVDLAFDTNQIVDGGMIDTPVARRVRVLSVPVTHRGEVLAVLSREFNPDAQRDPGELEMNYFFIFRRLARMIAEGSFPYPADETESEEAPRVSDGLLILDATARVQFASPNAVSALSRVGIADVEGQRLVDRGLNQRAVRSAFSSRLPHTEEVERGSHTVVLRCLPFVEQGEITGAMALMRDISELRLRDRLLVSKDATIAEIHHRVKNNLQTISSLLRLQARRVQAPEARQAIDESVRRIRSIAIVHEILSEEVRDDVPFDEIVRPLVRLVEEGLSSAERPLRFTVMGVAGEVPSATATPLAVVLTELLQNAVKHAFVGLEGPGTVVVTFANDGQVLSVTLIDDGVGVADDFELAAETGLGLTIVRTLVETDLGGKITIVPDGHGADPTRRGTRVELQVPLVRGWLDDGSHVR